MKKDIEYAIQQIIGFKHAREGYSFVQLLSAMGLKKSEWEKIKVAISLKEDFIDDGDKLFKKV